ncbi:MAG: hypothetical protein GXP25_03540 [Planctomycetes bacterium]|nr:hypothetical protein [Planctomycetota bacterium]
MTKKFFLAVMALALMGAITMGQEKKFESIKDCMMCLKMNRGKAMKAMDAGDMEKVAAAAGMMKKATMCMNKNFCMGKDFAACGKSFCEAVEKMEKAARDGDMAAAKAAMMTAKKGCMDCHKKCKK